MRPIALTLTCLIPLLCGCSSSPKSSDEPKAVVEGFKSREEVISAVEAVIAHMKLEDVTALKVKKQLRGLLDSADVKRALVDGRVSAAGAFHSGGGGLLVRVGSGTGWVTFASGDEPREFASKSFVAGAVLGGESAHGAFVVLDLRGGPDSLVGSYNLAAHGGAIAETSSGFVSASSTEGGHEIVAVSTSVGFSGTAGGGRGTFKYVSGNPEKGMQDAAKEEEGK